MTMSKFKARRPGTQPNLFLIRYFDPKTKRYDFLRDEYGILLRFCKLDLLLDYLEVHRPSDDVEIVGNNNYRVHPYRSVLN